MNSLFLLQKNKKKDPERKDHFITRAILVPTLYLLKDKVDMKHCLFSIEFLLLL